MESLTLHTHPPNSSCLKQVIVRLILPCERERWAALMRQHHYLGFVGMVGQSLRYVAECGDQWLVLLGWQSAALKSLVLKLDLMKFRADHRARTV